MNYYAIKYGYLIYRVYETLNIYADDFNNLILVVIVVIVVGDGFKSEFPRGLQVMLILPLLLCECSLSVLS